VPRHLSQRARIWPPPGKMPPARPENRPASIRALSRGRLNSHFPEVPRQTPDLLRPTPDNLRCKVGSSSHTPENPPRTPDYLPHIPGSRARKVEDPAETLEHFPAPALTETAARPLRTSRLTIARMRPCRVAPSRWRRGWAISADDQHIPNKLRAPLTQAHHILDAVRQAPDSHSCTTAAGSGPAFALGRLRVPWPGGQHSVALL
jgi:hypothetical protein